MTDTSVVGGGPFRSSSVWTATPDIQIVRESAQNEVNECPVGRPQGKVAVEPGRGGEDWAIVGSPAAVGDEQGVSGARGVVREAGAVVRPVQLGHPLKVLPRLAAQGRDRPDA